MRCLVILLIVFIAGCSDDDAGNKSDFEKKAGEVLKSILKGETSLEKGGITIPGSDEDSKITLSATGKKTSLGLPQNLEKRFVGPGVTVLSYIQGVDYDTINASFADSIDAVEAKYNKIMVAAGYEKIESVRRDRLLSVKWIKPKSEGRLFLYAYEQGEGARLYLVFTPVL